MSKATFQSVRIGVGIFLILTCSFVGFALRMAHMDVPETVQLAQDWPKWLGLVIVALVGLGLASPLRFSKNNRN